MQQWILYFFFFLFGIFIKYLFDLFFNNNKSIINTNNLSPNINNNQNNISNDIPKPLPFHSPKSQSIISPKPSGSPKIKSKTPRGIKKRKQSIKKSSSSQDFIQQEIDTNIVLSPRKQLLEEIKVIAPSSPSRSPSKNILRKKRKNRSKSTMKESRRATCPEELDIVNIPPPDIPEKPSQLTVNFIDHESSKLEKQDIHYSNEINSESKFNKKSHKRSLSDSSEKKIKRTISSTLKQKIIKPTTELTNRQEILSNSIQMGWVRVKTFSFSEKHYLYNKRFLVLCKDNLYLMKSQEVFAECTLSLPLKNRSFKILNRKPESCNIIIEDFNNDSKPLKLKFKESINTWVDSFEKCFNDSQAFDMLQYPDSINLTNSANLDLSLDLSKMNDNNERNQIISDDEISDEISKRLELSPPRLCSFSEHVHIFYPVNSSWQKRLIKLDNGIIRIYESLGNDIKLQGIIYLSGCTVSLLNLSQQPIDDNNIEDESPTLIRILKTNLSSILSEYDPSGEPLPGYFIGCSIDIQFNSSSILKEAVSCLNDAIALNVVPLESLVPLTKQQNKAMFDCDLRESVQLEISNIQEMANDNSFNVLLARYFKDIQHSETFNQEALEFIRYYSNLIYKPDFIGNIEVDKLDFSSINFSILDSQFTCFPEDPLHIIGEVSFASIGCIKGIFRTSLNLTFLHTTLAEVSVLINIKLHKILGKVHLQQPPILGSKTDLFFASMPQYELDVDISLTSKKIALENLIPKLKTFFIESLRTAIKDRLVYPNKITFYIPFAGRDISMQMEQIGNTFSPRIGVSCNEALKEATARFIEEVIKQNKIYIIPEIFTSDCEISGFAPTSTCKIGKDSIEEIVNHLQNAFEDLEFDICESLCEQSCLYIRFNIHGILKGSFWNHYDPGCTNISLEGSMYCNCKYYNEKGIAKLYQIRFMWHTDTLSKIMALPSSNASYVPKNTINSLRLTS